MIIEHGPYEETVIGRVVADVHRRWAQWVDKDDLTQEAMVWWYGPGQNYLPAYLTEDEHHVRLRRSIWRWCARYAEVEKAHRRGYEPIDQYNYPPGVIVSMLPYALDDLFTPGSGEVERIGSAPKGNLAEGGDLLASWADVRRAVEALDDEDQQYLRLADDLHYDWERIASFTGALPKSAQRRHVRLAERMARWLNRTEEIAA